MTTIFIFGCHTMLGASLSNYLIQHTDYQVVGWANLYGRNKLPHLEPSIQSKNRFVLQLYSSDLSKEVIEAAQRLYEPDIAIGSLDEDNGDNWSIACHSIYKIGWTSYTYEGHVDFLYKTPYVFGPRCRIADNYIAKIIASVIDESDLGSLATDRTKQEYLYIKDWFWGLLPHIQSKSAGYYDVHASQAISCQDIYTHLQAIRNGLDSKELPYDPVVSKYTISIRNNKQDITTTVQTDLAKALEHTMVWYYNNAWYKSI